MEMDYRERQLAIISQILRHRAFQETLRLCLEWGEVPGTADVVRIMKASDLFHVGADSTYIRRSSTVIGWMNWILNFIAS